MSDLKKRNAPGTEIGQGMGWMMGLNLARAASGLLVLAFAARILSSTLEVGFITFVTMVRALLVVFVGFALPYAMAKFIADFTARRNAASANTVFIRFSFIGFALGLVSSLMLILMSDFLVTSVLGMHGQTILIVLFSVEIFATMLTQFLHAALLGKQEYRKCGIAGISGHTLVTVLAILLLLAGYGLAGYLWGWIAGSWMDTMISLGFCVKIFSSTRESKLPLREMLEYSVPAHISDMIEYSSQHVEKYLILALAGTAVLGLYGPMIAIAGFLLMIPTAISSVLFPHLASIEGSTSARLSTQATIDGAFRWFFLLSVPLAFGLAVESTSVITLVAGSSYVEGSAALAILSVGGLIAGSYFLMKSVMLGMGSIHLLSLSNMASFLIGLFFSLFLIDSFGINGAAIARFAVLCLQFGLLTIVLRMNSEIRVNWVQVLPFVLAGITMSVFLLAGQVIGILGNLLLVDIAFGALLYLVVLRLQNTVTSSDVDLLQSVLPGKLSAAVGILSYLLVNRKND